MFSLRTLGFLSFADMDGQESPGQRSLDILYAWISLGRFWSGGSFKIL